jgi:hypothetical protein
MCEACLGERTVVISVGNGDCEVVPCPHCGGHVEIEQQIDTYVTVRNSPNVLPFPHRRQT